MNRGAMPHAVGMETLVAERGYIHGGVPNVLRKDQTHTKTCQRLAPMIITSVRKMLINSRDSGILDAGVLKVAGNTGWPMEHNAHPVLNL